MPKVIYWPFPVEDVSEWPGARGGNWADHVGTDFAVPQGTPLRATMEGTVDIVWNDGLGAWVINLIHPDGTVIRNGHMSHMAPNDGVWVNAGDYIGNTGGAYATPGAGLSTGAHLHWEIRSNNGWGNERWEWYDPRNLEIHSFSELDNPAKPIPTLYGLDNQMIVFYAHALGKDKPGWLVMGFTPKALIVSAQAHANRWAENVGKKTLVTASAAQFRHYLRAAGGTTAELKRVYPSA